MSLLVGGIGIMLVPVTKRNREIGTRLAIGALEREVLLQFLVEAVVLSSPGGIVLVMVTSYLHTARLNVPFIFNKTIVIIAFIFSTAVGVLFGYMPAGTAARLNPIDALRCDKSTEDTLYMRPSRSTRHTALCFLEFPA